MKKNDDSISIDEYLFRSKRTAKEFAESLGISRTHLHDIMSMRRNPSVKLAIKIEQETGKKVKKESLLFRESGKTKEETRK